MAEEQTPMSSILARTAVTLFKDAPSGGESQQYLCSAAIITRPFCSAHRLCIYNSRAFDRRWKTRLPSSWLFYWTLRRRKERDGRLSLEMREQAMKRRLITRGESRVHKISITADTQAQCTALPTTAVSGGRCFVEHFSLPLNTAAAALDLQTRSRILSTMEGVASPIRVDGFKHFEVYISRALLEVGFSSST